MNNRTIAFLVSFSLVISLAIVVVIQVPRPGQPFENEVTVPQGPRTTELWQLEKITLLQAQDRVSFHIKLPDNLPPGFSIKAVTEENEGIAVYKGEAFEVETVTLLFWDQDLPPRATYQEVRDGGGIWLVIAYSLGENTTQPYESPGYAKPGEVRYLWGYPAVVREHSVQVFQFEEKLVYRLQGPQYEREFLLKIMESIIGG